ncbi:MAG TPA: hypothetical protein VEC57_20785 [Candidatus Limnocylindrales bacterium]|nr:hypothetical protein [Candidatus Limnocylindrales bacterium]
MNHSEVICRSSPGYFDLAYALEMAATCKRLSGFDFRPYYCRCCTKYHLKTKKQKERV